jgi:hypothetical protein
MTLKAYRVDNPGSWSTLIYAETASKAKWLDFREYHEGDVEDIFGMRVKRIPHCDQFAGETPDIDDDPVHQLRAGIMQECWRCLREINAGDEYLITVPPIILCSDCAEAYAAD